MAEKLLFSLKVFTLGFSVVMIVLFTLYGLTALFNRFTLRVSKKEEKKNSRQHPDEGPSQQMAAAIAAALNYHQAVRFEHTHLLVREIQLPADGGSRWQAAGREELARKSTQVDLLRRKII